MHGSTLTPHAPLSPPGPQLPRLYTFRRCPYAMRARMALLQAGLAFEAVEVSLRDKPASLLALSSKATVPVLHLPDGSVIEESWDIMRWALAEPPRLPRRLQLLRGWSHEEVSEVFTRGARARREVGV